MEPEHPSDPPQHAPLPPGDAHEQWSSVDFQKRRRFWSWMSLAPAVLPLLAVLMAPLDDRKGDWLVMLAASIWITPVWLILCACMVPAPRHLAGSATGVFWKIGWFFLFIILHIVILYAGLYAGCTLMPVSKQGWH
jgi:hypothetical protein